MYKLLFPTTVGKVNDKITKSYFRSIKHHNKDSSQQILLKLNRLEKLEDSGYARQKLQTDRL